MKRCTYCGQEYSDEATACFIDRQPLTPVESKPSWTNKLVGPEPNLFPVKLKLRVREKDNGLWLIWKCPRCIKEAKFNAIVSKANIRVLAFNIGSPTTSFDLRCQGCNYELRVIASDREPLETLRIFTRDLEEGKITRAEYETQVLNLPARFAKDLAALTQNWKCAQCGEENPMSFDHCWSCSSRAGESEKEVSEDAKPFPTMPTGGNSWER